ncbi:MAG: hypothetical protein ABSF03_19150 [Streptosporangiaceae bacterium]
MATTVLEDEPFSPSRYDGMPAIWAATVGGTCWTNRYVVRPSTRAVPVYVAGNVCPEFGSNT